MKTLFLIILSSFFQQLFAPPACRQITKEQSYQFTILTNPQFRIYYPLIKAIVYVESRGNDSAYNVKEGAIGQFQIRKCRIDHFNRLTGKNYTHEEMYQYDKAEEVFLFFCQGKDFETAARNWNGKWSKTEKYWKLVKNQLTTQL